MRCEACNKILTQKEDSRVSCNTGERLGLCSDCLEPIQSEITYTEDPVADDTSPKTTEGTLVTPLTDEDKTIVFNEDVFKRDNEERSFTIEEIEEEESNDRG
jgi:hypothetical protein